MNELEIKVEIPTSNPATPFKSVFGRVVSFPVGVAPDVVALTKSLKFVFGSSSVVTFKFVNYE